MENTVSIQKQINEIKTSPFVLGCKMEMGYGPGLPILQIRRERLCLLIPYLKYKITGQVDQTLVYPIRYTICVSLPGGVPIQFEDLAFNPRFERVDFSEPVGLFRHESIQNLGKKEYAQTQEQLYDLYDKVANRLLYKTPYTQEDETAMRSLLQLLVTPELLPIYQALDSDFYRKYLR